MTRLPAFLVVLGLALGGCPSDTGTPGDTDGGRPTECESGLTECGDECVDLSSDPDNCGACGEECEGDAPNCAARRCVQDCGTLARCDGACVSLASDPDHCGSCDRACDEEAGLCAQGECVATCPGGEAPCEDGACPDTTSDPSHCGRCGHACAAEQRCEASQCVSDDACPPGQSICYHGDDPRCEEVCVCGDAEPTDCDDRPDVVECHDLTSSVEACGDCDTDCEDNEDCVGGSCVVAVCGEDQTNCPEVGCVDLHTDPDNCGDCGRRCDEGLICADEECVDGQWLEECDFCPCPACPDRAEPAQRCCMIEGDVLCVADGECPSDD